VIRAVRQSFAAGELAPELHMRSDLAAYQKGAARMLNMYPRRTGSALQRPGTDAASLGSWEGSDAAFSVVPFYYDNALSLVLLLAVGTARWFVLQPEFELGGEFTFEPDGWTAEDSGHIRAVQVGDTLFVSAPGRVPVRIVFDACDIEIETWRVFPEEVAAPPGYDIPKTHLSATLEGWETPKTYKKAYYALWARDQDGRSKRLFEGKAVSVGVPWQAGAVVNFKITRANIPDGAIGHTWTLCKRHGGGYGEIAAFEITEENLDAAATGSTVLMFVDDNIVPDTYANTQRNVREGDDEGGYGLVGFYQQRQVLAGNAGAPWSIWFSRLADLYTWSANRPADDMDAFKVTLPAVRASAVRHLVSGRRLLLLTEDGVYAVHSNGEGFCARTCTAEKVNLTGVGRAAPLDTGAAVLFFADDDATLLEMRYSFAEEAHLTVDRSVLSRHLTRASRVRASAWQPHPDGVLWVLLDDGSLLSFTFLPEHDVFGWARHEIRHPDGQPFEVLDIVAPGSVLAPERAGDEPTSAVCLVCRRGAEVWALRFAREGSGRADRLDWRQSVQLAAGAALPVQFARGAAWRRDGGAWREALDGTVYFEGPGLYEWGMPVGWALETLRPEYPDRATHGLRRRAVQATVRTLATGGFLAGAPGMPLDPVEGSPAPDAAHDIKLPVRGGWDWDGRVRLEGRGPGRAEILGVVADIEFEGGR
jgi:hypothetical protein